MYHRGSHDTVVWDDARGSMPAQEKAARPPKHRKFKRTTKPGTVIISGNPGAAIAAGTLHQIRKDAGLV
jgi:hypothetical protein